MAVVNQNQNNNQNQQQQADNLTTGGGIAQSSGGPQAPNAAPAAPGQARQGSGRFQNLSNYLKANQGAGQRMGQVIGSKVGTEVEKQKQETQKNLSGLAAGIQAGKGEIQAGQGFNQQLQNIGQGLSSFQNMENRAEFDAAAQKASQFAQQPDFNRFQNIQSGQAIDENALRNQEAQTLENQRIAQENIQNRLGQVSTEQGRFGLLKDIYGGKKYGQQYGGGFARLDQLLLQNDPSKTVGALRTQFGEKAKDISQLGRQVGSTALENQNLIAEEAALVPALQNQASSNQDVFNQMLGKQENVDFINKLRQQKLDEYTNAIKTRQFTKDQAETLGLTGNQYGAYGNELRTYNLDTSNPFNYIKQAQMAQGIQDIATEQDYDAYKALQQIAQNRDTGKLSGASQLGATIQQIDDPNARLAARISAEDQAFRDLAGQTRSIKGAAFGSSKRGNSGVGLPGLPGTGGGFQTAGTRSVWEGTGTLGNFINTGRADSARFTNEQDTGSLETTRQQAAQIGGDRYRDMMNNLLQQSGYLNQVGQLNLENTADTAKYKRFGRLV